MSLYQKQNIHDYLNDKIEDKKIFGFWLYLMSDCIIFATLFGVYMVLKNNIANGPSSTDIYQISFVFIETYCLLLSSVVYDAAMTSMNNNKQKSVINWLFLTFIIGACFIGLELYEFYHLIIQGYGPWCSAFLSGFFILISTHGIHVVCGLIWILIMILLIMYQGLHYTNKIRMQCLSLFWHFLDIVWICVFTVIYLMGII